MDSCWFDFGYQDGVHLPGVSRRSFRRSLSKPGNELEPGQAPLLAEPVPENGDILLFLLGLRTGTGILRMTGLRKTLENTCVEGLSNFEGVPCFRH